jgi:hypothetical protein
MLWAISRVAGPNFAAMREKGLKAHLEYLQNDHAHAQGAVESAGSRRRLIKSKGERRKEKGVVSTNQSQAVPPSDFHLSTSALLICLLVLCACSNEEITRAKIAEAEATGRQAAQAVGDYARKRGRYPAQLEEAYIRPAALTDIKLMSVDPKTGVVSVALTFRPVEGKSLLFAPTRNKDKSITWRCTSQDIEPKFLPEACQEIKSKGESRKAKG